MSTEEPNPLPATLPLHISEKETNPEVLRAYEEQHGSDNIQLRRVGPPIPLSCWLIGIVQMVQVGVYYGLTQPWQNYVQNPLHDELRPGALGLGQSRATAISYGFTILRQLLPLGLSFIADGWLGYFKTAVLSASLMIFSSGLLFVTSLPEPLDHGAGLPGFVVSIILIAIATAALNMMIPPFMGDQLLDREVREDVTKRGERVIIDPGVTTQSIQNISFWFMNIGSLAGIVTTWLELKVGFWGANLFSFCTTWIILVILLTSRKRLVSPKPKPLIYPLACRAIWIAIRNGFNFDAAKPSNRTSPHTTTVPWDDEFVEELQKSLAACKIFLGFPLAWLCLQQINNNLISQAGSMNTVGLPNDFYFSINPIAVVILLPIVERGLYPVLRRFHIAFPPIARVAVGIFLLAVTFAFAAIVQHLIYVSGPCYTEPLACPASQGGRIPNHINAFVQLPVYVILALAEIFFISAAKEFAYNNSPPSMKSFTQALMSLSNAVGAALGAALAPVSKDPHLFVFYLSMAAVMIANAAVFFWVFRKYDH